MEAMSEYTPTTERVRDRYTYATSADVMDEWDPIGGDAA